MTSPIHRTILPRITASGRRQGFYRLVSSVDTNATNPTALRGLPVPPSKQVDLPVGSLLVSATPSASARHHQFQWRYAIIPIHNEPIHWSDPVPHLRFLDFRDAVAAEILQLPPPPPPDKVSFISTPGNRPSPPHRVTTANLLYQTLASVRAHPDLRGLQYQWASGGFTHLGGIDLSTSLHLEDASSFVAWAMHPGPHFILPSLSFRRNNLAITLSHAIIFEAVHHIPFNNIETLASIPSLAPAAPLLLHQVKAILPDLTDQAWQAIHATVQPHGFRLCSTTNPNKRLLIPSAKN